MELTKIKGISDKREKDLNKLGILSVEDLVKHFPRSYLDLRKITPLKYSYNNDIILTVGKVSFVPPVMTSKKSLKYVKAVCEQEGEPFTAVWFNQPYVLSKLKENEQYLFYGRVKNSFGQVSLINPTFEPIDKNYRLKGIVPVYTVKGNLTQKTIRDSIDYALNMCPQDSVIPIPLQKKYGLISLHEAYLTAHNPPSFEQKNIASDRIAVEEYFALVSAFSMLKGKRQVRTDFYKTTDKEIEEFKKRFPFNFTSGQDSAVKEIIDDLKSPCVMNRLVQGDVGSGKTAVALTAMFVAVNSGYQSAFLCPTEVLAEQNYRIIKEYFPEKSVALLTGKLTLKEKKEVKENILRGNVDIVVGTHAIIEGDVKFKNLSLVICDEQHRFGVSQRNALSEKGGFCDVLVMSATPIPRTLSLIFYGDLDISSITDKPVGRQDIQTNIVPMEKYDDMLSFIKKQAAMGYQTYFVCPKIDYDEEGTLISVTELFEELKAKLPSLKIGLLHGKMKDFEKEGMLLDFKQKKYDCLVSTTVIEVGIDVKDATVMVIYNAERFGLSQLHQLRGRVGRSSEKSYCFLLSDSVSENAKTRLKILTKTNDGFKIAEYDYEMRGGGDFLGVRQSGKFISDLGNLSYSTGAIFLAKKLSDETFNSGFDLEKVKKAAMEKYSKLKDVTLN